MRADRRRPGQAQHRARRWPRRDRRRRALPVPPPVPDETAPGTVGTLPRPLAAQQPRGPADQPPAAAPARRERERRARARPGRAPVRRRRPRPRARRRRRGAVDARRLGQPTCSCRSRTRTAGSAPPPPPPSAGPATARSPAGSPPGCATATTPCARPPPPPSRCSARAARSCCGPRCATPTRTPPTPPAARSACPRSRPSAAVHRRTDRLKEVDVDAVLASLRTLDLLVLAYVVLVDVVQTVLLVGAVVDLTAHRRATRHAVRQRLLGSSVLPRVSVLAPAYNEESTVVASVTALLTLRYPQLEVVVVNDGSPDGTLDALVDALRPRAGAAHLPRASSTARRCARCCARARARSCSSSTRRTAARPTRSTPGSASPSGDAGLRHRRRHARRAGRADAHGPAVPRARRLRRRRRRRSASSTGRSSSTGACSEARAPRRFLPGVQHVEYLRAYHFGRLGWNRLGGNLIISGAFGLFRRDDLLSTGGYLHGVRRRGHGDRRPAAAARPRGRARAGVLRARPGGLDRGARVAGGPRAPARPLAPRAAADALVLPRARGATRATACSARSSTRTSCSSSCSRRSSRRSAWSGSCSACCSAR